MVNFISLQCLVLPIFNSSSMVLFQQFLKENSSSNVFFFLIRMDGVFFAVLLFLVHPAAVSTNEPRNGACRDNREEFGFALIGHDYKSFHADNFGRCFFKCSIDEICQSATFLWNSKECKMKNETKRSRPADFVENPAATYMENSFRGMIRLV